MIHEDSPIFPPFACICSGRGTAAAGLSDLVGTGCVEYGPDACELEKLKEDADVFKPVVEYGDWNVDVSIIKLFF